MSGDPIADAEAWIDVDLGAIASNVRAVRAALPAGTRILAVLKGDAYGHGAATVAPAALAAGADVAGVGTVAEGARLRAVGVRAPIFVMAPAPDAAVAGALAHDLELALAEPARVAGLAARARAAGRTLRVHALVDLGLGRDGCAPEELAGLVGAIAAEDGLELTGVGASLATFDASAEGPLDGRLARFEALTGALLAERPGLTRHVANSTAALGRRAAGLDMVRVGDALYGLVDDPARARGLGLRQALAVQARVSHVRRVPAGTSVGYDDAWVAPGGTWLGTLALGFADGLPPQLAQGGFAWVAGRACAIAGRVGMGATVLDLGPEPVADGEVATLLGPAGSGAPTLADWAAWAGADPYDLAIRIGRALPRRARA